MAIIKPTQSMTLAVHNLVTLGNLSHKRLQFSLKLNLTVDKVVKDTSLTVAQRVRIAGQVVRDAVVVNLSRPVRKVKSTRTITSVDGEGIISSSRQSRTTVDPESRSKPGEFPRADTTRLMKSIFVKHFPDQLMSRIGTNLKYGAILEFQMDRSYLRRTLNEMRGQVLKIIQSGLGGATASFTSGEGLGI
jgi:hypothetical protein